MKQQQHKFRGEKHDVFTEEVKKIALRANNDKNDTINRFNRKKNAYVTDEEIMTQKK